MEARLRSKSGDKITLNSKDQGSMFCKQSVICPILEMEMNKAQGFCVMDLPLFTFSFGADIRPYDIKRLLTRTTHKIIPGSNAGKRFSVGML
jgi:hypothetical protein